MASESIKRISSRIRDRLTAVYRSVVHGPAGRHCPRAHSTGHDHGWQSTTCNGSQLDLSTTAPRLPLKRPPSSDDEFIPHNNPLAATMCVPQQWTQSRDGESIPLSSPQSGLYDLDSISDSSTEGNLQLVTANLSQLSVSTNPKELGHGSHGRVYLANCRGEPCAVKVWHPILVKGCLTLEEENYLNTSFKNEVAIMSSINHPNVVRLIDFDSSSYVLVMEKLDRNLYDSLGDDSLDKLSILKNLASALIHIHDKGIVHGDLNPTNVLISEDGTAKLADFGFARNATSNLPYSGGNPFYMPPEIAKNEGEAPPTQKIDIFSFGLVILATYHGSLPKPDISNRVREVNGRPVIIPETERRASLIEAVEKIMPHNLFKFAVQCIHTNPEVRPQAKEFPLVHTQKLVACVTSHTLKVPEDSKSVNSEGYEPEPQVESINSVGGELQPHTLYLGSSDQLKPEDIPKDTHCGLDPLLQPANENLPAETPEKFTVDNSESASLETSIASQSPQDSYDQVMELSKSKDASSIPPKSCESELSFTSSLSYSQQTRQLKDTDTPYITDDGPHVNLTLTHSLTVDFQEVPDVISNFAVESGSEETIDLTIHNNEQSSSSLLQESLSRNERDSSHEVFAVRRMETCENKVTVSTSNPLQETITPENVFAEISKEDDLETRLSESLTNLSKDLDNSELHSHEGEAGGGTEPGYELSSKVNELENSSEVTSCGNSPHDATNVHNDQSHIQKETAVSLAPNASSSSSQPSDIHTLVEKRMPVQIAHTDNEKLDLSPIVEKSVCTSSAVVTNHDHQNHIETTPKATTQTKHPSCVECVGRGVQISETLASCISKQIVPKCDDTQHSPQTIVYGSADPKETSSQRNTNQSTSNSQSSTVSSNPQSGSGGASNASSSGSGGSGDRDRGDEDERSNRRLSVSNGDVEEEEEEEEEEDHSDDEENSNQPESGVHAQPESTSEPNVAHKPVKSAAESGLGHEINQLTSSGSMYASYEMPQDVLSSGYFTSLSQKAKYTSLPQKAIPECIPGTKIVAKDKVSAQPSSYIEPFQSPFDPEPDGDGSKDQEDFPVKVVFTENIDIKSRVIRLVEALGIWPEKLAADVIIYILVVIVQTKIGQMDSFSLAQTSLDEMIKVHMEERIVMILTESYSDHFTSESEGFIAVTATIAKQYLDYPAPSNSLCWTLARCVINDYVSSAQRGASLGELLLILIGEVHKHPRYWEAKDLADVIMYQPSSSSSRPPWYDGQPDNSTANLWSGTTISMDPSQHMLQRSGAASLEHPAVDCIQLMPPFPLNLASCVLESQSTSSNPSGVATACHPSIFNDPDTVQSLHGCLPGLLPPLLQNFLSPCEPSLLGGANLPPCKVPLKIKENHTSVIKLVQSHQLRNAAALVCLRKAIDVWVHQGRVMPLYRLVVGLLQTKLRRGGWFGVGAGNSLLLALECISIGDGEVYLPASVVTNETMDVDFVLSIVRVIDCFLRAWDTEHPQYELKVCRLRYLSTWVKEHPRNDQLLMHALLHVGVLHVVAF